MSLIPNTTNNPETDTHKMIVLSPDLPYSSHETKDNYCDANLQIEFSKTSDALNGQ